MNFMEHAAELVESWKQEFDIKLGDVAEGELVRRVAEALATAVSRTSRS